LAIAIRFVIGDWRSAIGRSGDRQLAIMTDRQSAIGNRQSGRDRQSGPDRQSDHLLSGGIDNRGATVDSMADLDDWRRLPIPMTNHR